MRDVNHSARPAWHYDGEGRARHGHILKNKELASELFYWNFSITYRLRPLLCGWQIIQMECSRSLYKSRLHLSGYLMTAYRVPKRSKEAGRLAWWLCPSFRAILSMKLRKNSHRNRSLKQRFTNFPKIYEPNPNFWLQNFYTENPDFWNYLSNAIPGPLYSVHVNWYTFLMLGKTEIIIRKILDGMVKNLVHQWCEN